MINFRVDNKLALVTGCSSGIGMEIAIELAQSGADIIGVSNDMPESGSDISKAVAAILTPQLANNKLEYGSGDDNSYRRHMQMVQQQQ